MLANTPLASSAMTAHAAQPHWTPPPQMQSGAGSSIGIPDLTTAAVEDTRKEWTNDACITITMLADTITAAYWLERTQQVKVVKVDKVNVIAFANDVIDMIQKNDYSKIYFGKDAEKFVQDTSMSVVYPSLLFTFEAHQKHSQYTFIRNKYLQIDDTNKVEIKMLLSAVFSRIFEVSYQAYISDVGEITRKKSKKKSKQKQEVNIIVPSFASCAYRNTLRDAVAHANLPLSNVFGHGIAAVTGALLRHLSPIQISAFAAEISKLNKKDVFVLFIHASTFHIDVALVGCEGGISGRQVSKPSIFQRISTVATSGTFLRSDENKAGILQSLAEHIKIPLIQGDADIILVDGSQDIIKEALSSLQIKLPLFTTNDSDAACGGSLLSAAELDSSKEYLQSDDGDWYISYLVSLLRIFAFMVKSSS